MEYEEAREASDVENLERQPFTVPPFATSPNPSVLEFPCGMRRYVGRGAKIQEANKINCLQQ